MFFYAFFKIRNRSLAFLRLHFNLFSVFKYSSFYFVRMLNGEIIRVWRYTNQNLKILKRSEHEQN